MGAVTSRIDATIAALAKNPRGRTTWRTTAPVWEEATKRWMLDTRRVTMRNSELVKLVRHGRFTEPKHFVQMLPKRLHDRVPHVQAILANYAEVSASKARSLDRAASVMDAAYRGRLMKTTSGWPWLRFALVTGAIAIPADVGAKVAIGHAKKKRAAATPAT